MKLEDVKVGDCYTAKVSGRIVSVRVTALREVPVFGTDRRRTNILAINEATGRRIIIRSPQRLRRRIEPNAAIIPASLAKSAETAGDWTQAAAYWRQAARGTRDPSRRERHTKRATWCEDMAALVAKPGDAT